MFYRSLDKKFVVNFIIKNNKMNSIPKPYLDFIYPNKNNHLPIPTKLEQLRVVYLLPNFSDLYDEWSFYPSMEWIWDYIRIDLSNHLLPSQRLDAFIRDGRFSMDENDNFICERGPRKTSIDTYLYNQCIEAGVTFEFNCEIKDPFDMPDPTIIATGLHKDMQVMLHRPILRLPVFASRRKLNPGEKNGHLYSWMDDYTRCYGYAANINDLQYINMFSYDDLTLLDLKKYETHIKKSTDMTNEKWDYFEVYVPTASPDAPRLFIGSKILAGTLAGMMCPVAFFGIHGSLVSGKIASTAVSSPEKAMMELSKMTSHYKAAYRTYLFQKRIPKLSKKMTGLMLKHPFIKSILPPTQFGIPGITDYGSELPHYDGKL